MDNQVFIDGQLYEIVSVKELSELRAELAAEREKVRVLEVFRTLVRRTYYIHDDGSVRQIIMNNALALSAKEALAQTGESK